MGKGRDWAHYLRYNMLLRKPIAWDIRFGRRKPGGG
jgi:hypothetical protein